MIALPEGFAAGHHTDREAWTGCTVVLAPPGAVAAGEVRGGGPGTREGDLLSPAANPPGVQAFVMTGGSAFGLSCADGVMRWLARRGLGYDVRIARVPLVAAAVVFDLGLGSADAWPGPAAGEAACEAASREVPRGSVGAGTGCAVGKLLGPEGWTKGGLGAATREADGARLTALAAVNAFGDVLAARGGTLAGPWVDGRPARTADLLAQGVRPAFPPREATTLVCLTTDAALSKTQAWLLARAATAGLARAVDPSGTQVDGDMVACIAGGTVEADPLVLAVLAAEVTSEAIRDAILSATAAPGCPALGDPERPHPASG